MPRTETSGEIFSSTQLESKLLAPWQRTGNGPSLKSPLGAVLMDPRRKYVYAALPPRAIRVLELQPGTSSDSPLVCRVVVQDIEGEPYEALSYVWGDPVPAATVTCIDGTKEDNHGGVGIGANLAKALHAFWPSDRPLRIWIDALCINQADLDERQSQVRMMRHVFGKAQRVLCWLGPFTPPHNGEAIARMAIDFIQKFNANPQDQLREANRHFHFGEGAEVNAGDTIHQTWLAIKAMFDVEYFHRAWIIQEVGLARPARIFWGNKNTSIDWTEVARFCRSMDDIGASLTTHLDLKTWVCNHINLVWEMKADGRPRYNFVEVLHWGRIHKCTDPRDYVYALLAHPSARVDGIPLMQPDYTKSMVQAYTDLAVSVITRTSDLDILAFVDHDGDPGGELPSWVPDWHAINLVAPLRSPTHAASPKMDDSVSVSRIGTQMVLKCPAVVIDSVQVMSDMINQTQLMVTTLTREKEKSTPFLIDHIWKSIVTDPGIPLTSAEQFIHALSSVLSGGYRHDAPAASGELQKQQQADCAAFILEFERIKLAGSSPGFLASLQSEDQAMVKRVGALGSVAQFVQDITWTSMCRKVFRTTRGHIGLGPRIMREGDICAVLRGVAYPMVFRRCEDHFLLVGPTLLYGFMEGEAENLHRTGDLAQQELQIF